MLLSNIERKIIKGHTTGVDGNVFWNLAYKEGKELTYEGDKNNMISPNTNQAINAYRGVLNTEYALRKAKEELEKAEKFIPEIERDFYKQETKKMRDIAEGREIDDEE